MRVLAKIALMTFLFSAFAWSQEKRDLLRDIEAAEQTLVQAKNDPSKITALFEQYYNFLFHIDTQDFDQKKILNNATRIARKCPVRATPAQNGSEFKSTSGLKVTTPVPSAFFSMLEPVV